MSGRTTYLYWGATVCLALGGLWLALLWRGWGLSPFHFTLDDAFITFRYAEHLAEGLGPVWIEGRDPVEGYSSFGWVLANAGFVAAGLSPVWSSKTFSLACIGILVAILAGGGGDDRGVHRLVAAAAVALSPAFLLIGLQGMETALAALLATLTAVAFRRSHRQPESLTFALFFAAGFSTILTRPDTAPFAAALSAVLFARFIREQPRSMWATAVGCALLPGIVYFVWRWQFYGHLLPNTVHVKSGSALVTQPAARDVGTFCLGVLGPYALAAAGAALFSRDRPESRESFEIVSVGVAASIGLCAGLFFEPLQGYLWRFQMPYYPVYLLVFVWIWEAYGVRFPAGGGARLLGVVVLIAAISFPLWTYRETAEKIRNRWHYDRAEAGKALARVPGRPGPAFVSEAGALSYYSGWRTVDFLGLTSEHLAREGLDRAFLESLDPTLVVMVENLDDPRGAEFRSRGVICEYLVSAGFELRAAILKTNPVETRASSERKVHLYFVHPDVQKRREIGRQLRGISGVRHVGRSELGGALRECGLGSISSRLK